MPSDQELERADTELARQKHSSAAARKLPAGRKTRGSATASPGGPLSAPSSTANAQDRLAESPDVSEDEATFSTLHDMHSRGAATSDIYHKFRYSMAPRPHPISLPCPADKACLQA